MTEEITANGNLPPKKVSPWRHIGSAVLYFLLYIVVEYLIAGVYSVYLVLSAPDGFGEVERYKWINERYYETGNQLMLVIYAVLLAVLTLIFKLRKKKVFESLGLKKPRLISLPLALVAGIGMSFVLSILMAYVEEFWPEVMESYGSTMDETYYMKDMLLYALAGVVGAPLIEELFFRHLMAGRLSRAIPRGAAIVLSSVIFGMVHQHPVQWIYAGMLGFAMACIYFAYDSILPGVVFHAGFNSVSLLSYIDTSGMSEAQLTRFNLLINSVFLLFLILGIAALVLLFALRTHKIFRKPLAAEPAAVVFDTPAAFPGVAPVGMGYFTTPEPVVPESATPIAGVAELTAALNLRDEAEKKPSDEVSQ
ncbi:MAG: lysostaphin resistance A-like protein [Eubacteriales bacterium]